MTPQGKMKDKFYIKKVLYKACEESTETRISTIEKILESITEARNNETKSSAGDKYETGRAMMQIEENNNRTQLLQALQVKNQLLKIDPQKAWTKVGLGSLVITKQAAYFISIGLGLVTVENKDYYCISPGSPIGVKMMDKKTDDDFEFNGTKLKPFKPKQTKNKLKYQYGGCRIVDLLQVKLSMII